ncbi:hypothetical protein XENTR_v10018046 [Xenopus tropicalis]|nr:hypothetical protein XENTR_v10018046 [Xenopus tropicalis]KAE8590400.1 hypothetical protein XENTR_v10018046 [Xenopus tropicalis]
MDLLYVKQEAEGNPSVKEWRSEMCLLHSEEKDKKSSVIISIIIYTRRSPNLEPGISCGCACKRRAGSRNRRHNTYFC